MRDGCVMDGCVMREISEGAKWWQCSKGGAYGGSVARRVEMVQHDEEVKWLLVTYHEEVVTDDTGWCKVLRLMLFLVVGCTAI